MNENASTTKQSQPGPVCQALPPYQLPPADSHTIQRLASTEHTESKFSTK